MKRDREAMGFIADALEQVGGGGLRLERNGIFPPRQKYTLFLVTTGLGQSEDRYALLPNCFESLERRRQLTQSAVDENQIGLGQVLHRSTRLTIGFAVATCDHFLHAGKIVGTHDGSDLEPPIVGFLHLPVFPDGH